MAGVLDLDLFADFLHDLYADFLHDADRSSSHPDLHVFSHFSMTPELLSDEDSVYEFLHKMVVRMLCVVLPLSNSACLFILE